MAATHQITAHLPGTQHTPRPEHPRPDWHRSEWMNLNGVWNFALDPDNRGEHLRWYKVPHPEVAQATGDLEVPFTDHIAVPFPWESPASLVHRPDYVGVAWYQRAVTVASDWETRDTGTGTSTWRIRPWLIFGAVDWGAKVWVDGRLVAEHHGGYTPFEIDLGSHVKAGRPFTLTVRVYDYTDAATPVGKQTKRWYTYSSGIWQTVYLEGRPPVHVHRAVVTTPLDPQPHAIFDLDIATPATADGTPASVTVASADGAFAPVTVSFATHGAMTRLVVPVTPDGARLWSPEEPHLYDVRLSVAIGDQQSDSIATYFGIREITTGFWDGRTYEYVLLNRRPIYLRGALDQAFHPDGVHSYPSDDTIRGDIEDAKRLGLNMLRCHIKINDPRYYYWADRLGMTIFYDFPCTMVDSAVARANWESTFREAIVRDQSHPSIIAWILFNETWGLENHHTNDGRDWVLDMVHLCKSIDRTRLVEDNSPCLYDHVVTDINTWHFYLTTWDRARAHVERVVSETYPGSGFNYVSSKFGGDATPYVQTTAPLLNSEYAGLSARQGEKDIAHSFRFLTTDLRRHDKICGYVYTELTDIEWEHNGLINYDRAPKVFGYDAHFPGMSVADINGADLVGFDAPPVQDVEPGEPITLAAFVSHWNHDPLDHPVVHWAVDLTDVDGLPHVSVQSGDQSISVQPYTVTNLDPITVTMPATASVVTVRLWLSDASGTIRARNYTQLVVRGSASQSSESNETALTWRLVPGEFTSSSWPEARIAPGGHKYGATGAGYVEYEVSMPANTEASRAQSLTVRFEAGSRTAASRRGWHDYRYFQGTDYPQTRETGRPSLIRVSVNGVDIGDVTAPDDFADARGVLSILEQPEWEYASAGTILETSADAEKVSAIMKLATDGVLRVRFTVPSGPTANGINLYGSTRGSTLLAPTIRVHLGNH